MDANRMQLGSTLRQRSLGDTTNDHRQTRQRGDRTTRRGGLNVCESTSDQSASLVIRTAGLDDVVGIHEVHKSDISEWRHLDGSPAAFERLSVLERYLHGGPWMSPESCAVYVNELILAGTPPIVAVRAGRVVGEMELLFGLDRPELGKAACLSILYVHRSARGQGVGRALIAEAVRRGRALACRTLETTDPEPEAIPFYRRLGFECCGELISATVTLRDALCGAPEAPGARELSPLGALAALRPDAALVIGRARHPALVRQFLAHAAGPGRLAIPGTGGLVRAFSFMLEGGEYTAFFRAAPLRVNGRAEAHVFGPRLTGGLVAAVEVIAARAGYSSLGLTVAADEAGLIAGAADRRSHFIWALPL